MGGTQFGMIGLGRMGANMTVRLMRAGYQGVVFDVAPQATQRLVAEGAIGVASTRELVEALRPRRVIFMMLPAALVGETIERLLPSLSRGDVLVDGGNSNYRDSRVHAQRCTEFGVEFVDMGTSGGVWGLERGYCLMLGGSTDAVNLMDPLLAALAPGGGMVSRSEARARGDQRSSDDALPSEERGYLHCGPSGAGHFVKMVHNGIEYALMAAYAEGFNILKSANLGSAAQTPSAEVTPIREPENYQYEFDLPAIAEVWRRGSVVTSWLLDLTAEALGSDAGLEEFSGHVSDSGEGRWTVAAANDLGVPAHVITAALFERFASRDLDQFQNRVVSAMRLGFGGHQEKK